MAIVKDGRIPIRLCNLQPYKVSVGRYQKLGRLYETSGVDIYGQRDLELTSSSDGVVDIRVVEAGIPEEEVTVDGVSPLMLGSELTDQQRQVFDARVRKWSGVFSKNEDDLGFNETVQHRIYTGTAPPVREKFETTAGRYVGKRCNF